MLVFSPYPKGEKEMKKRHQAEEVIRILRDIEGGGSVAAGLKRHKISDQTYYRWKKKYGGMSTDEAKRLKSLEQENLRLKRILGEQTLVIDGLREINRGKF